MPAGEIIHQVDGVAFGRIAGGAVGAVIQHVQEQGAAGVVAVQPEADAHKAAPILGDPGVHGFIFKGVHHAAPTAGGYVGVELEYGVARSGAGDRQRWGGAGGKTHNRIGAFKFVEADEIAVAICTAGQA